MDDFLELVYKGGKWKKWLQMNTADNKMLCSIIAGHYHFASPEYRKIIEALAEREDIKESIITALTEVIHHYAQD